MQQVVIENPVLNSAFEEPKRHFKFTEDGITDEIVEERRISQYFVPIPRAKKKSAKQLSFETEWTADRVEENKDINRIRGRVSIWRKGGYKPYTEKQLIRLVRAIKKEVPRYVRIQRIARDIPSKSISAGPAKISNLRQLVSGDCKCIRCREVKETYAPTEKLYLFRQNYQASGGKEIFLSYENKNKN